MGKNYLVINGYFFRDSNTDINLTFQFSRYLIHERVINDYQRLHVFLVALFCLNSINPIAMFLNILFNDFIKHILL